MNIAPIQPANLPYDVSRRRDAVCNHDTHEDHGSCSLNNLCIQFLHKMNTRFGSQSRESGIIHEVLDAFKNRKVTKRHAHSTIIDTLGRQDDLKKDLMNILYHRDSKWASEDFDLPITQSEQSERSLPQPTPLLLEPTHHPQMRMPSAQFSWSPVSVSSCSINPAVLSRYSGSSSMESSPTVAMPGRFSCPPLFDIPITDQTTTMPTSTSLAYETSVGYPANRQWDNSTHDHMRAAIESSYPPENGDARDYLRLPAPYQANTHQITPWSSCSIEASLEVPNLPRTLSFPCILSMPPPARRRDRDESSADTETEGQQNEKSILLEQYSTPFVDSSTFSNQGEPEKFEKKPARRSASEAVFIHALCGKGFASRYKVRKHHWGAKNDDLATKTGCWAKHGRPHSNWDDHHSCKTSLTKTRTAKMNDATMAQWEPKTVISQFGADTAPRTWTESPKTLPGFPTLQNLPQTVAAALKSYSGDEYLHTGEPLCQPQHSPRDGLENSLTTIGISLWNDGSKREARNDSVMSAAELEGQHMVEKKLWLGHFTSGDN